MQGDLIILGQTPPPESDSTLPTGLPPSALPQDTLLARYAYSQALARSTALSALEVSLDNYLSSMALLPESLVRTGRPGLGRVALVKKLGELLKFRQGLNLNRENFYDTPDLYWAEPVLESEQPTIDMYPRRVLLLINSPRLLQFSQQRPRSESAHTLCEREDHLRCRGTSCQYDHLYRRSVPSQMQSVLRQLLTETSGHRMELIIIALIAVEVVIVRIQVPSDTTLANADPCCSASYAMDRNSGK